MRRIASHAGLLWTGPMLDDLDAFRQHARRSTVVPDDVKLLARRDKSLVRRWHFVVPSKRVLASCVRPKRPPQVEQLTAVESQIPKAKRRPKTSGQGVSSGLGSAGGF